eukprot:Gb_33574 [translate_table: standard]
MESQLARHLSPYSIQKSIHSPVSFRKISKELFMVSPAIHDAKARAEAKIEALEAENADLKATLEAIKDQLSSYDSLILYPTYAKQLAAYPLSQRPMVELAMKANFYKSWHEIQQKTRAAMEVATARSPDKSTGEPSQEQTAIVGLSLVVGLLSFPISLGFDDNSGDCSGACAIVELKFEFYVDKIKGGMSTLF